MPEPETEKHPAPQYIGVREFRSNLSGCLRQVHHGMTFMVMSHDQILAEVRPPRKANRSRRRPGALRGRIKMAEDFDTLPDDVLSAIENGKE